MRRWFGWAGWVVAALLALGMVARWADARWLTTVPDVRSLSPAAAASGLGQAHLRIGRIRTTAGSRGGLQSEEVRSQNPASGRVVLRGSVVDLVTQRDTVAAVPSVIGLYYKDATATLSAAGYWCAPSSTSSTASTGQAPQTVSDVLAQTESLDAIVVTQTPPPGTRRSEGTTVTVTAKQAHSAAGTMSMDEFRSIHGALYLRYGVRGTYCVLCHAIRSCVAPSCHTSESMAPLEDSGNAGR